MKSLAPRPPGQPQHRNSFGEGDLLVTDFTLRRMRTLIGAVVLFSGLLLAVPRASYSAHAALACRSDPVLVVNLATVDVVSTLWTAASSVRELDYTVTVPAGSLIGKTTLTVGLGFPEKVTYVFSAAQAWGTMKIGATVKTQAGVAPFATTVTATSPLSLLTGTSSASGWSTSTVFVKVGNLVMV